MKRLLEMISLVFCALLMSCSNGISDKTGDINFSLNVEDALRAASLDRATDGSEDTANSEKEYIFLVQVKGSRNYYDYQIKSVKIQENTASIGNTNTPGGGDNYTVFDPVSECGNYVNANEAEVSFTFGYVPANQKYKVMFDMFEKAPVQSYNQTQPQTQYQTTLVLSGHSQDIQVHRGMQSGVEVDIANLELSPISLEIELEKGQIIPIQPTAMNAPPTNEYPPQPSIPQIAKKYGKLWYSAGYGQTYNPIKSIGYALDSNSNFPESSYKYSMRYGIYNNSSIDNPKEFTFDGDRYSLYDFLSGYQFPESDVGTLDGSSETLMIDSPAKITKTGSKGNISFIENAPTFNFKSEDEVVSGSRTGVQINFQKLTDYENEDVKDFVRTIDIYELLDLNPENYELTQTSKTIVLVLNMKGNNPNPNNTQLYYKLDREMPDWETDFSDSVLRNGNHCINLKPGETKFIIPFDYVADFPNLTLFMDANRNGADSLSYTFDVDYYIFPKDEMTPFIFNIKYNDNRYRYEMDEYFDRHVSPGTSLSDGDNLKNEISGVFCLFSLKDKKFIPISTQLTSELWYWDYTKDSNQYTTISQTPQTFTTNTNFGFDNDNINDRPKYNVFFNSIQNASTDCEKKVLIHADCQDTNYLLVIRDFNMTITIVNQ